MDQAQFATWLHMPITVPDPRQARGQRYRWLLLLTLLALSLASGQKTPWAIACWLQQHTSETRPYL